MANRDFESWMQEVDSLLDGKFGVTSDDLPDFLWLDHFDDGDTPGEAIRDFIAEGGML